MNSHRFFRTGAVAAALLALAAGVPPASAAEAFGTNIRPFFAVGPSYPIRAEGVRPGFGMTFGFEAEQWTHASVLFRLEWNRMGREVIAYPWFIPPPYVANDEVNVFNWSLGARAHLRPNRTLRPYGELCLGIRVDDSGTDAVIVPFREAAPGPGELGEGVAITLRLGLAGPGGGRAGFFMDSGIDVLAEHRDRFALAPIRLGVVFP